MTADIAARGRGRGGWGGGHLRIVAVVPAGEVVALERALLEGSGEAVPAVPPLGGVSHVAMRVEVADAQRRPRRRARGPNQRKTIVVPATDYHLDCNQ